MFTKNRISWAVRFILIVVLLGGTYGVLPIEEHSLVYALGETPGTLDTTFDGDGLVTTAFGSYDDEARAIAIQQDGKIVVAGRFSNTSYDDFFVLRYNIDGSLDAGFDTDGLVTTDFGGDDVARAMTIQDDGKIIVAGYTSPDGSTADYVLARYNTDGTLDTSFDSDGKLITSIGTGYDYPSGIAIQPDGKIIVVGEKYIGINDNDIAVLRYNENGSLDTDFDTDGIVTTGIGSGTDDFGASVALQSDGKIIVGGNSFINSTTKTDFVLVQYNINGSLDTSFDIDGIVTKDFGIGYGYERGGHVAIQSDGKIIVAGNNDDYFLLMRCNDDGSLDATFDTDGLVSTYIGLGYDTVQGISLQQNGKIVVAGYSGVDNDFAVARYNSHGSLDTDFDTDGKVFTDFGSNQDDLGNAVAIQADGKIVVAGYRYIGGSNYDVAVARYIGDEVSQIHYVKWDATGVNNGSSWTDAYTDLQSALSAASSGDQIWVAAGTYKPTSGTDRAVSFELKNGVAVYGGFAGTETLLSQRDWETNVTILSGDIGVIGDNTDNSYHVIVGYGVIATTVVDGFTIMAGNASDTVSTSDGSGGGMWNYGSPTLENLVFNSNKAHFDGGGIYNVNGSNPIMTNITFSNNTAGSGGGMYNKSSSPSLTKVIFTSNSASSGGGIYNSSSSPSLTDVIFDTNSSSYHGGGMNNVSTSNPILSNVIFVGNTADTAGGGMANNSTNSNPTLKNVTFYGNSSTWGGGLYNFFGSPVLRNVIINGNIASNSGGGIYNESNTPSIVNAIIWGNSGGEMVNVNLSSPIVGYSVVQGGCPSGSNCTNIITTDPKLGTLGNYGGFTQTIPLLAGSSAIDAGDDGVCPDTDQRGVTRPQGSHCDIGAYEFDGPVYTTLQANFSSVGTYDGWILESSETSNNGGTMNASNSIFYLGDDAQNKQYRAILHFDTSSLPDNAVIVDAKLRLSTNEVVTGVNPFTTHDKIVIELNTGAYSTSSNLQLDDFKLPSDRNGAGAVRDSLVNGFYRGRLKGDVLEYFNVTGATQIRLRFKTDDDDDNIADLVEFFSGNASASADRPRLVIYYYIP